MARGGCHRLCTASNVEFFLLDHFRKGKRQLDDKFVIYLRLDLYRKSWRGRRWKDEIDDDKSGRLIPPYNLQTLKSNNTFYKTQASTTAKFMRSIATLVILVLVAHCWLCVYTYYDDNNGKMSKFHLYGINSNERSVFPFDFWSNEQNLFLYHDL